MSAIRLSLESPLTISIVVSIDSAECCSSVLGFTPRILIFNSGLYVIIQPFRTDEAPGTEAIVLDKRVSVMLAAVAIVSFFDRRSVLNSAAVIMKSFLQR